MIARLIVVAGLGAASLVRAEPAGQSAAHPPAGPAGQAAARPSAEPPDPAVDEAGDANLESTANRQGLTFSASLGAGAVIGFGIDDSVGRGGAVDLRLGHVATPHTVITFEAGVTATLHRPATSSATQTNTDVNLLAGAQYYVNQSLWLRVAGGAGIYRAPMSRLVAGKLDDVQLIGPAVLGGLGLELARFKWAVFGVEIAASAMVNGDGVLVASDLALGLSFD